MRKFFVPHVDAGLLTNQAAFPLHTPTTACRVTTSVPTHFPYQIKLKKGGVYEASII